MPHYFTTSAHGVGALQPMLAQCKGVLSAVVAAPCTHQHTADTNAALILPAAKTSAVGRTAAPPPPPPPAPAVPLAAPPSQKTPTATATAKAGANPTRAQPLPLAKGATSRNPSANCLGPSSKHSNAPSSTPPHTPWAPELSVTAAHERLFSLTALLCTALAKSQYGADALLGIPPCPSSAASARINPTSPAVSPPAISSPPPQPPSSSSTHDSRSHKPASSQHTPPMSPATRVARPTNPAKPLPREHAATPSEKSSMSACQLQRSKVPLLLACAQEVMRCQSRLCHTGVLQCHVKSERLGCVCLKVEQMRLVSARVTAGSVSLHIH